MRLLAFTLAIAAPLAAQQSCDALLRLSLPEVTIVSATTVVGPFALPGANRTINAAPFCRVIGTIWPEVNFEVWLPNQWNRKFLGVGNGGQAGSLNYTAMAAPLREGYATATTDTGHRSSETAWALNHLQRIIDYGHRGTHVMTQAAKAIATSHYGRAPEHSYFDGCSNGGQAGSLNYTAMAAPLREGYATATTDTGHRSSETAWALNHLQRIIDYGHRGTHVMTQAAKAIATSHYGRAPEHSYFDGCSNGGRQALMEAQRYPGDYDGIIAGDPAADWTHLYTGGHLWTMRAMDGDGYIPAAKIPVLAAAVNKACDALDGVIDGILNDPRRCHFDPATLACNTALNGADTWRCFTRAQIAAIRKLWDGARLASGDQIQPGIMPGGEDGPGGWLQWITGLSPGSGAHTTLGLPGFQYMVYDNPLWDFRTFRYEAPKGFDSGVDFVDHKLSAIMNATDPDLRSFQARGGKLIQYHGWSDPDISPLTSIRYYEKVAQVIGRGANQNRAIEATDDFYRLFLVPGMQHCANGPGPNSFDKLNALEQWVEKGYAPDRIVAVHLANGQSDRTRPLCPYPRQAAYDGSGSTDQAENFTCSLPTVP